MYLGYGLRAAITVGLTVSPGHQCNLSIVLQELQASPQVFATACRSIRCGDWRRLNRSVSHFICIGSSNRYQTTEALRGSVSGNAPRCLSRAKSSLLLCSLA